MAFSLGDLFSKDSAFGQLLIWQVGAQVVGAVMAPGLNELTKLVNEAAQTTLLTPDALADLVVRNYLDQASAEATAKRSGVSPDDFALMVKAAGDAVDTTTLIAGYRRGILAWDSSSNGLPSVLDGIREGRLADKWAPLLQQLGDVPLGVADAMDAGKAIAYTNGLSPENFEILYNTRGNPPGVSDLAEMVRRGVIPQDGTGPDVLSFQQGVAEGATKNKWLSALEQIMTVLPAEGRVTTLLRNGTITRAQAIAYYQQLGYDQAA